MIPIYCAEGDLSPPMNISLELKFLQAQLIIIGIRFDGQLVVFLDFDLLLLIVIHAANQMQREITFCIPSQSLT